MLGGKRVVIHCWGEDNQNERSFLSGGGILGVGSNQFRPICSHVIDGIIDMYLVPQLLQ